MRIDQLISELNKCRKIKNDTEKLLAVSESESESMKQEFELLEIVQEDEISNLESKVSKAARELIKLATRTSCSLEILADRILAWELETSSIIRTANELLDQKLRLQSEVIRTELNSILLAAEKSHLLDTMKLNQLYLAKERLKSELKNAEYVTFDRGCQTSL